MEQRYKTALEIILAMVEKESYMRVDDIKLICETVLGKDCDRGDSDECA